MLIVTSALDNTPNIDSINIFQNEKEAEKSWFKLKLKHNVFTNDKSFTLYEYDYDVNIQREYQLVVVYS